MKSEWHSKLSELVGILESVADLEKRVEVLTDLLVSAHCIARRNGTDTNWTLFAERIAKEGIGSVTPRVFKASSIYPDKSLIGFYPASELPENPEDGMKIIVLNNWGNFETWKRKGSVWLSDIGDYIRGSSMLKSWTYEFELLNIAKAGLKP